ncbi:MAG: sensor histidine kinase, partial [Gorillibacterium sp.]|nr:sensor histidine kinase [Gorillibacterium sp.]
SQVSDKMMGTLDAYIEDMKKISIIPSYLDVIKSGLQASNRFYEEKANNLTIEIPSSTMSDEERNRINIQRLVENSIYFINNLKKGTNTVYLFDRYGHSYFVIKNTGVRSDISSVYDNWKNLASAANGTPVLVSTQETSGQNTTRYVFTVVREIIDTSFTSLGMIAVDANIEVIENIVEDLDKVTKGTTLIIDNDNRVIYDSQKKYLSQKVSDPELLSNALETQGSFHRTVDGEQELTIYRESLETGWKVFITIPQKHLMADALRIRNSTLAITIAIACFVMFISIILVFALTSPLRMLVRLMKEAQTGNLQVVFPVRRRDEVGVVGNAFNRMINRIRSLIDDIQQIEQRKKEAELDLLQHQINPHFIYNTLESIRMTALLHDDSEVEDMTRLLGKMLRYSIHQGIETVPLEQEWEHLRMYVNLLNYRYNNQFTLELPQENLSAIIVLKLLFQPIVENSISHGLDKSTSYMEIVISYKPEGMDHVFTITDDGVGIDADDLQRIRETLNKSDQFRGSGGIGLRNVHERIKLRYGNAYGLQIESALGKGTVVTIRLPAVPTALEGGNKLA